jgi:hypothetical protein
MHFLPFLLNHLRLPPPELHPVLSTFLSNYLLFPFITSRHGPRRKQSPSIVKNACLLIRCLQMDVILMRAYASTITCLPNRCLAMGPYVTILKQSVHTHRTNISSLLQRPTRQCRTRK